MSNGSRQLSPNSYHLLLTHAAHKMNHSQCNTSASSSHYGLLMSCSNSRITQCGSLTTTLNVPSSLQLSMWLPHYNSQCGSFTTTLNVATSLQLSMWLPHYNSQCGHLPHYNSQCGHLPHYNSQCTCGFGSATSPSAPATRPISWDHIAAVRAQPIERSKQQHRQLQCVSSHMSCGSPCWHPRRKA